MSDVLDIARDRLELLCDEYREKNGGISESQLARRMGYLPQKLAKLLALQIQINAREAKKISDFFNVSIAWLYGETEIRQKLTTEMQTAISQLLKSSSG